MIVLGIFVVLLKSCDEKIKRYICKLQIINSAIGLINELSGENVTLPLFIIEIFIACGESVKNLCNNKKLLDECLNGLGKNICSKNKNISDKNKKSIIKIYLVLVQNPNGKRELNKKIPKVLFNKKFYDSLNESTKKYMDSFYSNFLENDDKRLSKIICDIIGNESKIEKLKICNNNTNPDKIEPKDLGVISQTSQLDLEANFSHLLNDKSSVISNTTNPYPYKRLSSKVKIDKESDQSPNNVINLNEYNHLRNSQSGSNKQIISDKKFSDSDDIFEECLTIKDHIFKSMKNK